MAVWEDGSRALKGAVLGPICRCAVPSPLCRWCTGARERPTNAMPTADRHKSILLFGAPGAGKGTQGKILGTVPGFYHLSTGDMFRNLDRKSELGRVFQELSSRGELVPDDLTIALWRQHVTAKAALNAYRPHADVLLLDGIPRNVAQARLMEQHIEPLCVLHLDASNDDAMVERLRGRALKEQRADDAKEEVIRRRLDVYRKDTQPVLDCYPKSIIARIDALGTPAEVALAILKIVAPIQKKHFPDAAV